MLHRYSALAIAAAFAGSAFLGTVSLPRPALAQAFDNAGPRPFAMQTQEDFEVHQGHARFDHRQEVDDSPVGPVPFPHHRPAGYGGRFGDPSPRELRSHGGRFPLEGDDRPWGRGDDRPGYGPRFDEADGLGFPDQPYGIGPDEEVVSPVAPPIYQDGRGPDAGCTIQRSESVTAVGWRKIVTHKTCYRR